MAKVLNETPFSAENIISFLYIQLFSFVKEMVMVSIGFNGTATHLCYIVLY